MLALNLPMLAGLYSTTAVRPGVHLHQSRVGFSPVCDGKKVMYGDSARNALLRGVDKVANAVKVTIGPRGRNVVLQPVPQQVVVINDGVSIASDIDLSEPEEQVGAKLLLQACSQTDSRAGDGTTTSAVLTQAICKVGAKYVSNGVNAVALQRGLIKTASFFVGKIREAAMPVTTYEQFKDIASISSGSEEMGEMVADALQRVGADGAVTCEAGKELRDSLEIAEGLEHECGYANEAFVKEVESQTATLDQPRVLVTNQALTAMQDVLPVLEGILGTNEPLLIICLDIKGEALSGLALNKNKGVIDVCACKAPGFGDVRNAYLEDLCTFCGAKFITSDLNLKPSEATLADLGKLDKAVISKNKMLLVSNGEVCAAGSMRASLLWCLHTLIPLPRALTRRAWPAARRH